MNLQARGLPRVAGHRQGAEALRKVVEAAGGAMADIFKITLMIKHRQDYAVVNQIRGRYFPERSLISTGYQCELLRDDMLIEVDAMALIR